MPKILTKIKITRSRTAQSQLNSLKARPNLALLREIQKSEPLPNDSSASINSKSKRPVKGTRGVRRGGIGGGDLSSTMVIEEPFLLPVPTVPTVPTVLECRSFGTTCQPKSTDKSLQVIHCSRCDGFEHTELLCNSTNVLPQNLFCKNCKVTTKKYISNTKLSLEITLCPTHTRAVQDPVSAATPKEIDTAKFLLQKIYKLVDGGRPLPDAIKFMGLTTEKFNRFKLLID